MKPALSGTLLHGVQIVGRPFVHADGNDLHAFVLVVLLQGDKAILIGRGHGTVVAREDHDDRFGILEIGKAVRFVVGADDARPLRRRIADVQLVCRKTTAGSQNGRDKNQNSDCVPTHCDHPPRVNFLCSPYTGSFNLTQ